jgi:hypothetical protein
MRTEAKVFAAVAGFLYVVAAGYAWWTHHQRMFDWTGTIVLVLAGTLAAICGGYFAFVARRIPPRPSDRLAATIAEGAGPVGYFSPSSYWPLGIGLGVAILALGLASAQLWLAAVGLGAVLVTVAGLLFENYGRGRAG